MKKLVTLALTLVMLVSIVSISFAEEMPTLELWITYARGGSDTEKVSEELSKITAEKIGCKVNINPNLQPTDMALTMASNEQVDVVIDSASWNYVNFAQSGAYLDLTEMLPSVAPAQYALMTDNMKAAAAINGKIYGVPSYKDMFLQGGVWLETETVDALNLDLNKSYTVEDLEPILEYLYQQPEHKNSCLMLLNNYNFHRVAYNEDFAILGALTGNALGVKRDDPTKIVNIFATPEYAEYVKLMNSWYNKGYIVSDVATVTSWSYYYTDGSGVGYGMKAGQYVPLGEVSNSTAYGAPISFLKIGDCVANSTDLLGAVMCVAQKSQYPEYALKLIELLNTDTAAQDVLAFGIEGEHYTREDGKVKRAEGYSDKWNVGSYLCGDVRVRSLMVGETEDRNAQYEQWNSSAKLDVITGFFPDTTNISGQIAAVNTVIEEYGKLMGNGALDPEEYLPIYLSALEEAGMSEILAELNAQYETFLEK